MASPPNQRTEWLRDLRNHIPSDAVKLLSATLPSVLGFADYESLDIVIGCLYHSDASVRRYAMNGFSYWPADSTSRKLLAILHTRGPSDELVRFLMRQREFGAAYGTEIVNASLPFLASDSTVAIDGAIAAFQQQTIDKSAVLDATLRSAAPINDLGTPARPGPSILSGRAF